MLAGAARPPTALVQTWLKDLPDYKSRTRSRSLSRRRSTRPTASCSRGSTSRTARSCRSRRSRPYLVNARRRGRGRALLPAQRRRPRRHRARRGHERHRGDRAGRLDDHAAVHPQHDPARRAHGHDATRARCARRTWRSSSRSATPSARSSRCTSTPSTSARARTVRRRRRSTYFNKHGEPAHARRRRPLLAGLAQSPSRLDPYDNPEGAVDAPQRGARPHAREQATSRRPSTTKAVAAKLKLDRNKKPDDGIYAAPYFVAHVKKLLQTAVPPARRLQGRADGLHDARHPPAEVRRARGRSAVCRKQERPGGRARVHRPAHRLRQGDRRRTRLPQEQVQPRDPGLPPAGFVVQDVRARDARSKRACRPTCASTRPPRPPSRRSRSRGSSTTARAPGTA